MQWRDLLRDGPQRARIVPLLIAFEEMGAVVIAPTGTSRSDYVNVTPPLMSRRQGRVCSVKVNTGRVEFQADSGIVWSVDPGSTAVRPATRATRSLAVDLDVEALIIAFAHELEVTW